jgi:hypothetical protein
LASHPLAGRHSVEQSAALIRHYRYAEERLMRTMGGWIALTPELPVKLLFGRHVWDCAQHADLWGRRLPELRAAAQRSEPASEAVVRCFDEWGQAEGREATPERLVAVYRVVKPHLAALYERHLAEANAIYEPPTRRILERCLDEERRHVAAGAMVLAAVVTPDPVKRERAAEWEARVGASLAAAGGILGDGFVGRVTAAAHPHASADVIALGNVFVPVALPPGLAEAVERHRRALAAGDLEAAGRQVADASREAVVGTYAGLGMPARGSEIVAVAEIGEYRLVKLALLGARGTALLVHRWRRSDDGWRISAADVVRVEPPSAPA